MNYKDAKKQCIYCAEYFEDETITNSLYGICPRCKIEPVLGCTCNKCGAEISLAEYDSNFGGYCDLCVEEELDEYFDEE